MTVLGIDPGSQITGYGLVSFEGNRVKRVISGAVRTKSSDAMPRKLGDIFEALHSVIRTHRPDQCAIETAFYSKNVQSTLKLGQVRGVAIIAAVSEGVQVAEYSPREIKLSVTGTGAASKQQVEFMVKRLLFLDEELQTDEADSLAVAICHCFRMRAPESRVQGWTDFAARNPGRIRG